KAHCLTYKKVANKVRPIAASMPNDVKIICRIPEDPLKSLPEVPLYPPAFKPGCRLTAERMEQLGLFSNDFLWSEEQKLVAKVL
ncbi:hypothetical protein BYT27DRAFT_7069283, partial [Phlegmacium glaucopus]